MGVLEKQIGGKHYKGLSYQVVEVAADANLNFFQASILKYVSRYKEKNGLQDLEKSIHYAELGEKLAPQNGARLFYAQVYSERNDLNPAQADLVYSIFKQDWSRIIDKIKLIIFEEIRTLEKEMKK